MLRKGFGAPVAGLLLAAASPACADRERLTFAPDNNGRGPTVFVDQPLTGDTTVNAGPQARVAGKAFDADGVDTLYFSVIGGNETIPPFVGPRDTVRFGFGVNTAGLSGRTVFLQIFGTDRLGNRGDTATITILVR
ncbi:MAG: hypothetical protein H0U85_01330 [Gemmatimonadales bacterium]|nr:hypothetical protein [Gemmatimonadales bacterium]